MPEKQVDKPIDKLQPRIIRYAEILAEGTYSKYQAAIAAGYSKKVAAAQSWEWIGNSRNTSKYPQLWDFYENLRIKNLRQFAVNAENVLNELVLIGFSDVTKFVDLPSIEYNNRKFKAMAITEAFNALRRWDEWIKYENERRKEEEAGEDAPRKKGRKAFPMTKPDEPTAEQERLVWEFERLPDVEQKSIMIWENYSIGSIRIKYKEEIPKELLPAIAEISETREGIRLKLHDKLPALAMLAKHLKMFDNTEVEAKYTQIQTVQFVVNGSKSKLLDQELGRTG